MKTTKVLNQSLDSKNLFHCFARSTTGYKKRLLNQNCEDSVKVVRLRNAAICAVADGHGDSRCTYANIGAQIATEVTCDVLRVAFEGNSKNNFYEYVANYREDILKNIIKNWNHNVFIDYLKRTNDKEVIKFKDEILRYIDNVFSNESKKMNFKEAKSFYAKNDEYENILHKISYLYGTTINAVIESKKFIFALSLGDGDIIAAQGKRIYWLIPPSDQFSTKTESLCFRPKKALEHFNTIIVRKNKSNNSYSSNGIYPDFVLLATDGLRNSFFDNDHFVDVVSKLVLEKKDCYIKFQKRSQKWIDKLTKDSLMQDDISFGFIY